MPALVSLDQLTGAAFVGFVVSVVIYGITCLQAYMYYAEYSSGDRKLLKAFVGFLVILDSVHVALVTHALYWYMVTNFGNYTALSSVTWSLGIQVIVAQLLALSVQSFFAWRVYLLSDKKNIWIPAIVALEGVGLLVSTAGFMVVSFHHSAFDDSAVNLPWSITMTIFELTPDLTITISMIYYLVRARTGFNRTQKLVNTLILYILNTCLLTTIFAALTLAVFTRFQNSLLYAPFFFVFCRIYACSFLSTLNTRHSLRRIGMNTSTSTENSVAFSDLSDTRRARVVRQEPITFTTAQESFPDGSVFGKEKAVKMQV